MAFEYRIIHSANSSTFESIVLCGILKKKRTCFTAKIDNLGKCSTMLNRNHARWTASLNFKIDRIPHRTMDSKVELFAE